MQSTSACSAVHRQKPNPGRALRPDSRTHRLPRAMQVPAVRGKGEDRPEEDEIEHGEDRATRNLRDDYIGQLSADQCSNPEQDAAAEQLHGRGEQWRFGECCTLSPECAIRPTERTESEY